MIEILGIIFLSYIANKLVDIEETGDRVIFNWIIIPIIALAVIFISFQAQHPL